MANIMLTKQCNLNCPYCFANEFVNRQSDVMSYEDFLYCLNFLSSNPRDRIGLIGGEPTTHPDFKKILIRLIDSPFSSICLFTNGILLDRFINELRNSKFQILINLNSPMQIGEKTFGIIMNNIRVMISEHYMKDQLCLSLNFYKPDMDFQYILDALSEFQFRRLRISIAVPNIAENRGVNPLAYFHEMEDPVRGLIVRLLEMDIAPVFDCNYPPVCLIKEEDKALFNKYAQTMCRSNLPKIHPICRPVLDILPDLRVVRCLGMSEFLKVSLKDFRNIEEIERHFYMVVDALAYNILPSKECRDCIEYITGKCSCGCYAYRLPQMTEAKAYLSKFGVNKHDTDGLQHM